MRKFTVIKSWSFCFNPPSTHPGPAPKPVIVHCLMCIKLDWPLSVGLPSSRFLESSRNAPCVSLWWSTLHFCRVQKLQSHYRFACWDLKLFITVGNTSENMWKTFVGVMWHCHDRSGVSVRNMIQGRGWRGDRKGRVGGAVLPRPNQTPGGDSHMKQTGMLVRNFEFNP